MVWPATLFAIDGADVLGPVLPFAQFTRKTADVNAKMNLKIPMGYSLTPGRHSKFYAPENGSNRIKRWLGPNFKGLATGPSHQSKHWTVLNLGSLAAGFNKFVHDWEYGNDDDPEDYVLKVLFHCGNIAEEISEQGEGGDPHDSTDHIV